MEVNWLTDGILLSQDKYIKDLLSKVNMSNKKLAFTPCCLTIKFAHKNFEGFDDPTCIDKLLVAYNIGASPGLNINSSELSITIHASTNQKLLARCQMDSAIFDWHS